MERFLHVLLFGVILSYFKCSYRGDMDLLTFTYTVKGAQLQSEHIQKTVASLG